LQQLWYGNRVRKCAFCGGKAKLSGEHLWSAWIRNLFPDEEKFVFRRQFADAPIAKWWESKNLDPTAKVVCEPCNNEWMSELENDHAKPALTPMIVSASSQTLTPSKASSIASFMFKQAVICHFMDRTSTRYPSSFFCHSTSSFCDDS